MQWDLLPSYSKSTSATRCRPILRRPRGHHGLCKKFQVGLITLSRKRGGDASSECIFNNDELPQEATNMWVFMLHLERRTSRSRWRQRACSQTDYGCVYSDIIQYLGDANHEHTVFDQDSKVKLDWILDTKQISIQNIYTLSTLIL